MEPLFPFSVLFSPGYRRSRRRLDKAFTSLLHCREAASTTRRFLVMVRQFYQPIKSSIYSNFQRHNVALPSVCHGSQLKRFHRLATWIVGGLRHVSREERLRCRTDPMLSKFSKVKMSYDHPMSSSFHPE